MGEAASSGDGEPDSSRRTGKTPAQDGHLIALPGFSSSPSPIVLNVVLPPIPAGCRARIRVTEGGFDVTVEHSKIGYTIEEACALIPGAPHPQTLRAHLEKHGIPIGMCGRAPLISYEQLFAALRLSA